MPQVYLCESFLPVKLFFVNCKTQKIPPQTIVLLKSDFLSHRLLPSPLPESFLPKSFRQEKCHSLAKFFIPKSLSLKETIDLQGYMGLNQHAGNIYLLTREVNNWIIRCSSFFVISCCHFQSRASTFMVLKVSLQSVEVTVAISSFGTNRLKTLYSFLKETPQGW